MKTLQKLIIPVVVLISVLSQFAVAQTTPLSQNPVNQATEAQRADVKPFDTTGVAKPEKKSNKKEEVEEVTTELTTPDHNAFYASEAQFAFAVKNTTKNVQEGTVSYQVTSESGEKLNAKSIKVKIPRKSSRRFLFNIPESKPGFYKVAFMINVTDYDDTTRKAFGIRPEEIRSQYKKPGDFESFWQSTKDELAKVAPNFRCTHQYDSSGRSVYLIEMQSLDNMTVRGWMTVPITKNKNKKFPVWLGLPGYQVNLLPIIAKDDEDLAIITLNVRGQGNSRGPINTPKAEYISYRVEDRNKYVMRGAIMDCIRCIDFIFSRKDLNHDKIFVTGGSLGGYLAVATAALDHRVAICSAQNPILSDVRNLINEVEWPMSDIKKYVGTRPGTSLKQVLDNLDYFDIKNFAPMIDCPMLMAAGLLDPLAPPDSEYAAYNLMGGDKHIMVFKNLGHEVKEDFGMHQGLWMRDEFVLF